MAVFLQTTHGDLTVDLIPVARQAPTTSACASFTGLAQIGAYRGSVASAVWPGTCIVFGDIGASLGANLSPPGGCSAFRLADRNAPRYVLDSENPTGMKHDRPGIVGLVHSTISSNRMSGSQFYITLGPAPQFDTGKNTIVGVVDDPDSLTLLKTKFNKIVSDPLTGVPREVVAVLECCVLEPPEPVSDVWPIPGLDKPELAEAVKKASDVAVRAIETGSSSALTPAEMEAIRRGDKRDEQTVREEEAQAEQQSHEQVLRLVGDMPLEHVRAAENVLFVCKLNPVTDDEDLELIFSRFGKIVSCQVVRDAKTGDSLGFAFVEFEAVAAAEAAYFKMDNVLVDDRRIHVDFSQSVSKTVAGPDGRALTLDEYRGLASQPRLVDRSHGRAQDNPRQRDNLFSDKHANKYRVNSSQRSPDRRRPVVDHARPLRPSPDSDRRSHGRSGYDKRHDDETERRRHRTEHLSSGKTDSYRDNDRDRRRRRSRSRERDHRRSTSRERNYGRDTSREHRGISRERDYEKSWSRTARGRADTSRRY